MGIRGRGQNQVRSGIHALATPHLYWTFCELGLMPRCSRNDRKVNKWSFAGHASQGFFFGSPGVGGHAKVEQGSRVPTRLFVAHAKDESGSR